MNDPDGRSRSPSQALLDANERLLARRAQLAADRAAAGESAGAQTAVSPHPTARPDPAPPVSLPPDSLPDECHPGQSSPNDSQPAGKLPAHLGWESTAVSRHLRAAAQKGRQTAAAETARQELAAQLEEARADYSPTAEPAAPTDRMPPTAVRLYPDLALALLRAKQTAPGRIWLLLAHYETTGRGWLSREAAFAALCDDAGPACPPVCGPRQLRKLLERGQGLFWHSDEERIWLRSTVKVAAALGLERLSGRPVALPLAVLRGPIGDVRAHFYAAFHSSRAEAESGRSDALSGKGAPGAPISRQTLETLSGASRRTQQAYERRAGVAVHTNIAVGPAVTAALDPQPLAWQRGRALFRFRDHRGRQGPPGRDYYAWRLPNSYQGSHRSLPRGRQRRLNQQLADLRNQGDGDNAVTAGNDRRRVEANHRGHGRRYHRDGAAAGRAWSRERKLVYWRCGWQRGRGRTAVWAVLPGEEV